MFTKVTILLEKKCCDLLLGFLEAFLKRDQGEDLYITLKTIKWVLINISFSPFFFIYPFTKRFTTTADFQPRVIFWTKVNILLGSSFDNPMAIIHSFVREKRTCICGEFPKASCKTRSSGTLTHIPSSFNQRGKGTSFLFWFENV